MQKHNLYLFMPQKYIYICICILIHKCAMTTLEVVRNIKIACVKLFSTAFHTLQIQNKT